MRDRYTLHLRGTDDVEWSDEGIESILTQSPDVKVSIDHHWEHIIGRGHFTGARRDGEGGLFLDFLVSTPSVARLWRVWVTDEGLDPEKPIPVTIGFLAEKATHLQERSGVRRMDRVRVMELSYARPPQVVMGSARVFTAPVGAPLDDPSTWTEVGTTDPPAWTTEVVTTDPDDEPIRSLAGGTATTTSHPMSAEAVALLVGAAVYVVTSETQHDGSYLVGVSASLDGAKRLAASHHESIERATLPDEWVADEHRNDQWQIDRDGSGWFEIRLAPMEQVVFP